MNKLFGLFLTVLMCLGGGLSASATERILNFTSNIVVMPDSSLRVKEIIRVKGERRNIRRGIYRDIPVRYRNKNGTWRKVGFKIIEVKRDGKKEPYHTTMSGDYKRIYIGKEDVFLPSGEFLYEITYATTRQLRYFEEYDELYWNVTGVKWRFPIDEVVATITLPKGAVIAHKKGFTGRFRSRGMDFQATELADNVIRFQTDRGLGRREGLTVAIGWQKGIVKEPSRFGNWFWYLWDQIGMIVLAMGTVGIAIYYYTTWDRIGRDPEGGVIIPLFSAPEGLSPAAVSYIHYRKFKGKGSGASLAFIAALVSLAVKKHLVIDKPNDTLTLKRLSGAKSKLPKGEKAILSKLLASRKSIKFNEANSSIVQAARQSFKRAIEDENGNIYFNNNIGFFVIGVVLSAIILVLSAVLIFYNEEEVLTAVGSLVSAAGGSLLLAMGLRRLWEKLPGGGSKIAGVLFTLLGVLALLPAFVLILSTGSLPQWVPAAFAVMGAMNIVFFNLLHAPTELGRQVMDKLEGFKLYLSVAEADRMNMRGAPEVTPEVFEKFLPYAIAMGVEKPWSKALETQLAKAGAVDTAYHPDWYHGSSGWSSNDLGAATAGIVGGVAAGMAAASPPSSSGSSGGGGFSGGGGGGGGGGGW